MRIYKRLSCLARNLHYTVREREERVVRITGATAKAMMTAVLLAGLSAMVAESRAEQTGGAAAEPAPEAGRAAAPPPRASRLKFRSGGPMCSCATGLGEADIQAAERLRRDPAAGLRTIIQDQ